MNHKKSNYRLLRFMGKFLTGFNLFFVGIIVFAWLYAVFSGQGVNPFEPIWALPVFGVAFGEICRAIADIADRQQPYGDSYE